MDIDAKKQIEIALLAGIVAKDALNLQGIQDYLLLRMSFASLIEDLTKLEKAFPPKR